MCFFSRSGYRPFIKRPPKSTFRYNSMFNFIPVSFCFFVNFRVRLGLGSVIGLGSRVYGRDRVFGFGIGNLKVFYRWRCRHSGRFRPLDACLRKIRSIGAGNKVVY